MYTIACRVSISTNHGRQSYIYIYIYIYIQLPIINANHPGLSRLNDFSDSLGLLD